tara:strand:- start:2019 stop:2372 length:354 start_codon:yes stop_codon:yes gene_type:complete
MQFNSTFLLGIIYIFIGQILVFFQTNAQFIWPKLKDYTLWISMIGGIGISYLFIKGVGMLAISSNGEIWPTRIIPSAMGVFIFATLTYLTLSQGISMKTGVCLILSFTVILIQIFWK